MRMFARYKGIFIRSRKNTGGLKSFDQFLEVQTQNVKPAYLFHLFLKEPEKSFHNKSGDMVISGSYFEGELF